MWIFKNVFRVTLPRMSLAGECNIFVGITVQHRLGECDVVLISECNGRDEKYIVLSWGMLCQEN